MLGHPAARHDKMLALRTATSVPMNATIQSQIASVMSEGDELARTGRTDAAEARWRRALELDQDFPPALNNLGMLAAQRGDLATALGLLQRAATKAPEHAMTHANLSRVHGAMGNGDAALAAISDAIAADPAAWGPHMEKARLLEAQGRLREAAIWYSNGLSYLPQSAQRSRELQPLLEHARRAVAENQAQLREFLLSRMGDAMRSSSPRQLERFRHSLDVLTGHREQHLSKALTLPFERLPAIPFFHREDFDWTPAVEAAFPQMLGELQALLDGGSAGFVPYVQTSSDVPKGQFATLDRNLDWSACFLWKNGRRIDENADRCPLTESALLEHAPLCSVPNRAPVAFFSALKPGTRIAPHNGATNTRLTVHMPLLIPGDCALRVGGETHIWKPGELVMFDDTIRHEAWNLSDQLRVVLIFDIWHPMLTSLERELVAQTITGMLEYNGADADMGEL